MVIHNQIFEAFRIEKKKEDEAVKLLRKKGWTVYNESNRKKYINK